MSVSYRVLTQLRPASLHQASTALSGAVTKLATEHTQYKMRVVAPLKAKRGWHGGGQPDAAAVAEVNGLAIDTTRLRAAAGAAAYTYAFAGFTVAQVYLAALEKQIKADDMSVDADGNVSTSYIPVADDGGPGSTSATVLKYQADMGKILRFATTVDDHASHTLNTSHEPPVTALANQPGLLDRARVDNSDAAGDARGAVDLLKHLGEDAKDLPDLRDLHINLPTYHVDLPPDASPLAELGARMIEYGLEGAVGGAMLGLALTLATEGGSDLAGGAASAAGALVVASGLLVILGTGVTLSQVHISQTSGGGVSRSGGPSKNLDDLMQQANQVENQTKPGYGGNGLKGFNGKQPWTDKHGFRTNGKWTINGQQAKHLDGTPGKTQFSISHQEADDVVLDAASYADRYDLWDGSKAKVYVGRVLGYDKDGNPIDWVNVYRTERGSVHGCPGNPP